MTEWIIPQGNISLVCPEISGVDVINEAFAGKARFLSEITGLPVARAVFARELPPSKRVPRGQIQAGFRTDIVLGSEGDFYYFNHTTDFSDKYTPGEPLPCNSWSVGCNGQPFIRRKRWVEATYMGDFYNPLARREYIWEQVAKKIGEPDQEAVVTLTDSFTLPDLNENINYVATAYLAMMMHMRERGMPMPPFLWTRPDIAQLVEEGEVEELKRKLVGMQMLEAAFLEPRLRSHIGYESELVIKAAQREQDMMNPAVPLRELFPNKLYFPVYGDSEHPFRPHNILAVENDLHAYFPFDQKVLSALERDGRWEGSLLISEHNLPACIKLCATGQIDLVIFDWSNPSHEEALFWGSGEPNIIFEMLNGKSDGLITMGDELLFARSDGKTMDKAELAAESERLDIRSKWMEMIAGFCHKKGVMPPAFYIVRNEQDLRDLSKIVAQRLNKPLRP